MKKIYKIDLGTVIFVGVGMLFFVGGTILALFVITDTPIWVRIISPFLSLFSIIFFIGMLKYDIIITDDSISTKLPLISFLNKYQTMKFAEIEEVSNAFVLLPENPVIFLKSYNKKIMSVMIGFGLSWDALLAILARLPKDVKINFEPDLWRRIKKPLLNEKVKKINIIATVIISLTIIWFSYFLWNIFKLHRIPFPINFFIGNPNGKLF